MQPARTRPSAIPITSVVAFIGGLVMAWVLGWRARDLMWSLWLSSLVLGYLTIVMLIASGAVSNQGTDKPVDMRKPSNVAGGLALLLFFTFHFGMFHFVHSVFLHTMFPMEGASRDAFPGPDMYGEVIARYWPFVLVTAVAQWREVFFPAPGPNAMTKPYANVVRMHVLILFFGFISFVGLENFFIYALVYAVYFLPLQEWLGFAGKQSPSQATKLTGTADAAGDNRMPRAQPRQRAKSARLRD